MVIKKVGLLTDTSTGAYDQTKTMLRGNSHIKTINAKSYAGPALNKWLDVITDSGISPLGMVTTSNGRIFVMSSEVGSTIQIACYTFNFTTGASVYVGKITVHAADLAATTHTIRALKVIDTGTTGWKIFYATTGSVAINGGTYLANKVDLADFTFLGTDFPYATGNDQKATYFLQDPGAIGVGQLQIASAGAALDVANNRLYVHNGVAATHQYYVYNTATAPTYTTASVNVTVASPGKVQYTAHPFLANDPVTFSTGPLPTGLVVGNTYFVRNPTANDFELSVTTGGASINTTGSPGTGVSIGRAAGTTGSNFVHKTGNLPALSGTLITVDSEDYALPQHTANSGFGCVFFGTTTTMYLGKLSELTSGATTWPSLITANNNGPSDTITQNARAYSWGNTIDRTVINTSSSLRLILKQMINSSADRTFGRTNISVYEAASPQVVYVGANAETNITAMDLESGWFFLASSAPGQRGVLAIDMRSDSLFGYSYLISPVQTVTPLSVLKNISRVRALDNQTDGIIVNYRLSGFGSEGGGWLPLTSFEEYTIPINTGQIQFKIEFDTLTKEAKGLHAQLNEILFGYEDQNEISENWEFSDDFSDNITPSRTAFRLKKAYTSSVPTLYYRAYTLADALVVNHNSVTNATNFEYSTNNGTSWLPLGTIPNVVGTLVRYTFTSPPGVDIRPGLKES